MYSECLKIILLFPLLVGMVEKLQLLESITEDVNGEEFSKTHTCACYHGLSTGSNLPVHISLGFLHRYNKKVCIYFPVERNTVIRTDVRCLCPRPVFLMLC